MCKAVVAIGGSADLGMGDGAALIGSAGSGCEGWGWGGLPLGCCGWMEFVGGCGGGGDVGFVRLVESLFCEC